MKFADILTRWRIWSTLHNNNIFIKCYCVLWLLTRKNLVRNPWYDTSPYINFSPGESSLRVLELSTEHQGGRSQRWQSHSLRSVTMGAHVELSNLLILLRGSCFGFLLLMSLILISRNLDTTMCPSLLR